MQRIAIIGGGAAGMMAAATICEGGKAAQVYLIERNPKLGFKVVISGGGRCNVTTGFKDLPVVLKKYPRGARFLKTAMYEFPPDAVYAWMEAHGVPLKIEEDGRVFPISNKGSDIVMAFENLFQKSKLNILYKSTAQDLERKGDAFVVHLKDGVSIEVDKVVLTTGGQAYKQTGSLGDGYRFAKKMGHKITNLAASLGAFTVEEAWMKSLSGLSFEEVKLKIGKHEFSGPILFTHKGITGPAVFALQSLSAYEPLPAKFHLDFCPELSYEEVRLKLEQELKESPKKLFKNSLGLFVAKSLALEMTRLCEIDEEKPNMEVSKKDMNKTVEFLKNAQVTVTGLSAGEEFVTAGGVDLSEVNAKTMESRICPGLYFAGEILDVDGFTGGYNLQCAWATGRLAGLAISTPRK